MVYANSMYNVTLKTSLKDYIKGKSFPQLLTEECSAVKGTESVDMINSSESETDLWLTSVVPFILMNRILICAD